MATEILGGTASGKAKKERKTPRQTNKQANNRETNTLGASEEGMRPRLVFGLRSILNCQDDSHS